jgi:hypothetical protein
MLLLDWLTFAAAGALELAVFVVAPRSPPELQAVTRSAQNSVDGKMTERAVNGRSIVGIPFK